MENSASDIGNSDVAPLIEKILDLHEAAGRDRLSALRDVLGWGTETDKAWLERLLRTAAELAADRPAP